MLYDTIREATYEWGREFNAVPRGIVEKLIKADGGAGNAISEVTPPSVGNYAYVFDKEAHGIVVQHLDDDKYLIELDDGEQVELNKDIILLIAISPCVSVVLSVFLSAAFAEHRSRFCRPARPAFPLLCATPAFRKEEEKSMRKVME